MDEMKTKALCLTPQSSVRLFSDPPKHRFASDEQSLQRPTTPRTCRTSDLVALPAAFKPKRVVFDEAPPPTSPV